MHAGIQAMKDQSVARLALNGDRVNLPGSRQEIRLVERATIGPHGLGMHSEAAMVCRQWPVENEFDAYLGLWHGQWLIAIPISENRASRVRATCQPQE